MEYTSEYFTVTLNNVGAMFHPIPAVMNISRIENKENYYHYTQGISPLIASYIEKVDIERGKICEKMNSKFISVTEWLKEEYNTLGDNLYENLQSNKAYAKIIGPQNIDHRYIYDDILTGLVPLYKTAVFKNVEARCMKSFIDFASLLLNYDFILNGRDAI